MLAEKFIKSQKLYYLGSTKSESDVQQIGAHGEGGKKVFSDLARLGVYNPVLISGDKALIISVGDEVENTNGLRPLIYNYFKINNHDANILAVKASVEEINLANNFKNELSKNKFSFKSIEFRNNSNFSRSLYNFEERDQLIERYIND